MRIMISSGHGRYVRGASGYLDEVNEARRVVDRVTEILSMKPGIDVKKYHDNKSTTQNENLKRIVSAHNAAWPGQDHLDISVHFNSTDPPGTEPIGTECWYMTQKELAAKVATAVAKAGHLIDRGPKYSDGLYFLVHTVQPSILIEVVFVSSKTDCDLYEEHFDSITQSIADTVAGDRELERPERPQPGGWHENITATVFGMEGDEQEGAYGGWIDEDTEGVSFPYKWRDQPRPQIEVEGPDGSMTTGVVDVGPWNTDDPDYVLGTARPLAELQYEEGVEAQNGQVPSNDAGIDLTQPVADRIGISGKGKVRWRIVS